MPISTSAVAVVAERGLRRSGWRPTCSASAGCARCSRSAFSARSPTSGLTAIFAAGVLAAPSSRLAWLRKRTRWSFAILLPGGLAHARMGASAGRSPHDGAAPRPVARRPCRFSCSSPTSQVPTASGLSCSYRTRCSTRPGAPDRARGSRASSPAWGVLRARVLSYDAWAWTHPPGASGSLRDRLPPAQRAARAQDGSRGRRRGKSGCSPSSRARLPR